MRPAQDKHDGFLQGRVTMAKCAYKEADLVSRATFCKLRALGDVLVVLTASGTIHVRRDGDTRSVRKLNRSTANADLR